MKKENILEKIMNRYIIPSQEKNIVTKGREVCIAHFRVGEIKGRIYEYVGYRGDPLMN